MTEGPLKAAYEAGPMEGEIGRFENEHGERFVVFDDRTFSGSEVDWKREPLDGEFLFNVTERKFLDAIVTRYERGYGDSEDRRKVEWSTKEATESRSSR